MNAIWLAIAGFFKLILTAWMEWRKKEAEKKRLKMEAKNEMKEALESKDPQRVTDAFDKVRRAKNK